MRRIGIILCITGLIFTVLSCDTKQESPIVNSLDSLGLISNLLFPTHIPDRIILNLTEDAAHSVAVNWRTDTTIEISLVQVAIATHGPEFVNDTREIKGSRELLTHKPENDPEVSAAYHAAIIDNLNPGEKYVYRVGSEQAWSEWFQIQMPNAEKKISFLYFGDAQNNLKSMWSRVIRQAYSTMPDVDFMLHAGDLINRHDRDEEWGEWFYSGSFIHAMVPSVMTPGNHEYKDVVLSPQWRPQFNLPLNGPKGLEETCYEVNYPNLKIVSLDAEQIDESEPLKEAQRVWLDSVLTNNPKKWTVLTFHYPIYCTKPNRDNIEFRTAFKPIFDKHKVDIVLQGHDHAYGRGMVNNVSTGSSVKEAVSGTMYVVSVSGPKQYDVSDDPWMERRAANTQLFQVISIEGNVLSYGAHTATGELYDAFNLVKSKNAPNKLINKIPDMPERLNKE
jgi:hypothetical protein